MQKKKLFTLVGSLALVGAIGVGATLAYFTDNDSENNVITMGHVNIELDEPIFEENPDNTITGVRPGDTITKDPRITVVEGSEDSYIRAKVDIKGLNNVQAEQLLNNMNINSSWVNGGDGYFYYQHVVSENDSVYLFNQVTIPSSWGNEIANVEFEINVTAEAIQADNFVPERNELNEIVGWNDEAISSYEQVVHH